MARARGWVAHVGRWLLLVMLVGACQASATPAPATPSPATSGPIVVTPTASVPPTPPPAPTLPAATATSPSPSPSSSETLAVDPELLAILPASVDGVTLIPDPETAASLIADPSLSSAASGLAIGRYIAGGDAAAGDIAVVSVVRLRPGVFSDPFFTTWRSDYDASACEPAGGATGTGSATIAGRAVITGTCAGGATTYHLHLAGDVLVAILSVGPGDMGADVIAGLRP